MNKMRATLQQMSTHMGATVYELSFHKDVLLVFLRHFGCTFCREALEELSRLKRELSDKNISLVLIHMSTEDIATNYFQKYDLLDVDRIADPDCHLYKEFGLLKGTFNQLFGFRSWVRGIDAGVIKGHGFGMQLGDGFQMPGVFLVRKGKIASEYRHKYASDKPDYMKLVHCPTMQ